MAKHWSSSQAVAMQPMGRLLSNSDVTIRDQLRDVGQSQGIDGGVFAAAVLLYASGLITDCAGLR